MPAPHRLAPAGMRLGPGSRTVASLSAAAAMLLLAACSATMAQSARAGGDTTAAPTTRAPATTGRRHCGDRPPPPPPHDDGRPPHDDRRAHHHGRADDHPAAPPPPRWCRRPSSPSALPEAGFVAVGTDVRVGHRRIQQRLLDLGFWTQRRRRRLRPHHQPGGDGVPEVQRARRRPATSTRTTADALTDARCRAHGQPTPARSSRSTRTASCCSSSSDGRTAWVFNTSTGSGQPYEEDRPEEARRGRRPASRSRRNGLHTINRERAGGLVGGRPRQDLPARSTSSAAMAVHGFNSVPNYPASHGCVRVSAPGDGLHLGRRPDADAASRCGCTAPTAGRT